MGRITHSVFCTGVLCVVADASVLNDLHRAAFVSASVSRSFCYLRAYICT